VQLANGAHSIHSLAYRETMHPAIGPAAEAEALYVAQLRLGERMRRHAGEFVIWDVGLGAAANALAVLVAARDLPCPIRLISFDDTIEPLAFALRNVEHLDYLSGFLPCARHLVPHGRVSFDNGTQPVEWRLWLEDFPELISGPRAAGLAKPHAILFDPYSPARNPAMWTLPLLSNLFGRLDPARPCALATYSRSTMTRVSLLLAGFYVGVGGATGLKDETTVAANQRDLIERPLGRRWLERARRSHCAEPLEGAEYRQQQLSSETWEKLQAHPQFR
jgi:tRNA U34 5-methylaminomethyl-2-thiouridine-forming methyltransferase MnmC